MTIKIKRVLEYNLDGMNSELQFAKIAIMNALSRLKDVVNQPDFISYHSTEEMEECKRKVEELSNMLQKIEGLETDIKYFKNKSLELYKKLP